MTDTHVGQTTLKQHLRCRQAPLTDCLLNRLLKWPVAKQLLHVMEIWI